MTECRLLIVDNNKVFLKQLEMTIDRVHKPYAEKKGIALSIEKAYSSEALKKLDGETYDIILSDLCLTDEDEEDPGNSTAIQWLETIKGTEPIIILLSDYIDNDEIVQSIIERFTGIRIIPKNPVSLWKMQLFSALDQFQNYSMPIRYMDRNLVKLIRQLHGEEDLKRCIWLFSLLISEILLSYAIIFKRIKILFINKWQNTSTERKRLYIRTEVSLIKSWGIALWLSLLMKSLPIIT